MNKKFMASLAGIVAVLGVSLYMMQNCGDQYSDYRSEVKGTSGEGELPSGMPNVPTPEGFVQIERLGRPAVNEGLVVSNDKLNAFNSIPPTFDLAVDNPAVLSVLQEASGALDLFDSLEGKENFKDGFDSEVVAGFLPDVMRIDTSKAIPPGTAAYNGDFVLVAGTQAPMLTGGRKIEDDVVDITLSYLVAGDPSGKTIVDNVSYQGTPGNSAQGHKKLHGQTAYNGSATFPFLATPY